jgi:NADH-quinone oxidoreductase subunit C/D
VFDWAIFRERKDFFKGSFGEAYRFDHDHHHIHITCRDFSRTMSILRNDMGFSLMNDIAVIPTQSHPLYEKFHIQLRWDVTYHLFHLEAHQRLQVHLLLSEDESIPSVLEWFSGASRLEAEAIQTLGLMTFDTTPMGLPHFSTNPNLSEAPYPEELNQWYLFDVNHSLTRHQFALAVESKEGKVQKCWLQSGYWKRGWEEKARQCTPLMFQPLLDGLIPNAAPLVNIAWTKTLEDYFLWRIPERAQAVRMIFMELSRISQHMTVMSNVAEDLGVNEATQLCREIRERVRTLFEFYAGSRVATHLSHFGGLAMDLPAGWVQEAMSLFKCIDGALVFYRRMVTHHPLARRRLKMAGITAQVALEAGLTGPALRATGVNFDLRKSRPFYFYQDIDFDVPVGMYGHAHDRTLILIEECYQSLRILWQVLDNLPLGSIMIDLSGIEKLNAGASYLANWNEWYQKADRAWSAQYTAIEGPGGELGFHLVLHPNELKIWSLKIKTNATLIAQAMPSFLRECPVADLSLSLSSLHLEASCLDR